MTNQIINKIIACLLLVLVLVSTACKKNMDDEQVRLFRPVLKGSLSADGNYINVGWELIKGAKNYTLQLSTDTFKTILRSVVLDSSHTTFDNLKWDQKYQLQVAANAPDSVYNSRMSFLGEIKTAKFPTILNTPGVNDVNATQVRVSWVNGGAAVTSITILNASDSSIAKEVTLTGTDITALFKLVDGLKPSSPYIIFLYSGTSVRGWANFATTATLSGNIIDLTTITGRPNVLTDTLPLITAGSIVLLKKGETYNVAASLSLSKAVTITSGDDLIVTVPPTIYFTSTFTFASGASVDYIRFEKVNLKSDNYGSRYVFNVNAPCNVAEISFDACKIEVFRGITRLQSQDLTVGKYALNNCLVDSLKDYGILSVDGALCLVQNISLTNSTVYKCEKVLVSTKPTRTLTSAVVENCTFNEFALGGTGDAGIGNALIDFSNMKFTGNISFRNNIVGPGWKKDNAIVRGIRPGAGAIDASNNYGTADYLGTNDAIPGITAYAKTSADLFADPLNGNFMIKDNSFAGKSTAGDPRWRP